MMTHCMNCGTIIHERAAILLPRGEREHAAPVRVQREGDRMFIRCNACRKKNYFIKCYAFNTVILQLSHVEG